MTTILVVDDNPDLRDQVCFSLRKVAGYETLEADSRDQAIEMFNKHKPDLVVLDISMPDSGGGEEGLEVCRVLRQQSFVPIVFLTNKDEEIDRIVGLELGGDDYVSKRDFSPRELTSRVKAVLRRVNQVADSEGEPCELTYFDLRVDSSDKAYLGKKEVILTTTEFNIFRAMLRNPKKVHTRYELMELAYDDHRVVEPDTIDSHVTRFRKKFQHAGRDPIEAVRARGYRLVPSNTDEI